MEVSAPVGISLLRISIGNDEVICNYCLAYWVMHIVLGLSILVVHFGHGSKVGETIVSGVGLRPFSLRGKIAKETARVDRNGLTFGQTG